MTSVDAKQRYEFAVCEDFIHGFYNHFRQTEFSFIRPGEQGRINEPDCIYSDGLNIEVTAVYYSQEYAQLVWDQHQGERMSEAVHLQAPDEKAFAELEERLLAKHEKCDSGTYTYAGKIVLLLDAKQLTVTDAPDFRQYLKKHPHVNCFEEVWLRTFDNLEEYNSVFLRIC